MTVPTLDPPAAPPPPEPPRRRPDWLDRPLRIGRSVLARLSRRRPVPGARRGSRPVRSPRPPASTAEAMITTSTMMVALVCAWVVVHLLLLGSVSHDRAQDLLYRDFREQVAAATAPMGPIVDAGAPVALIEIPRLGLSEVVAEGTASGDLLGGPGHLRNTVLPGQAGVSVVFGRAATFGAPFAKITALEPGDDIEVRIAQGSVTFNVLGVRRAGDPIPEPPEPETARLTLVTAEGEGRFRALSPGEAVYVDAVSSTSFPAPGGRPGVVPDSEMPMAVEPAGLPLLALRLGLLLAVTLGVIAARQRWSAVVVWVAATPPALALSWASTDAVMRLMPNLI